MSAVEPLSVIAQPIAPSASAGKPRGAEGVFAALVGAGSNPGQGAEKRAADGARPEAVPATPKPADAALAAVAAAPGQPQPPPFASLLAPPPTEAVEPASEGETAGTEGAGAALVPTAGLVAPSPLVTAAAPTEGGEAAPAGSETPLGQQVSAFAKALDPSARGEGEPGEPAWAGKTAEGEEPAPTPGARVSAFVAELKAQGAPPPEPETAPAPSDDAAVSVPAEGEETLGAAAAPVPQKPARTAATPVPASCPALTRLAEAEVASGDETADDADRGPLAALTKSTPGRERSGGPAATALEAVAAAAARREGSGATAASVVAVEEADASLPAAVDATVHGARAGAQGTGAAAAHVPVAHAAAGSADALAQVNAQMLRRLDGRAVRFDMDLHPADLGRVSVSLEIDRDGRVSAAMAFDNAQTAADMRARSDELRRMLEQAGFTLSEDAFSFTEREARDGGSGPDRETLQAGRAFADSADLVETADRGWRSEGRIRAGGVDVRI